ncbi:MAG: EamA family transporter RarD [Pseudomonadales bacterium]|nr:EamA family transporter RarD [Pseudomonadales bacterium]
MFNKTTIQGAYFALTAYIFWGVLPIYFKSLDHVSPLEILIQRVLWSVVLLLIILFVTKQLDKLIIPRKKLGMLFLCAVLLSTNWLIFIFAILNNNIVETSLGYFINPLFSVFLGMIFLGERLRPLQWLAVFIAMAGILLQLVYFGAFPWIALSLAITFGVYGLIRKKLGIHSIAGLTLETLMISPFAILGLIWIYFQGEMKFLQIDLQTDLLLVSAGFITSIPLLCFAAAITRLSLTASGMFQYIAPSLSLVIAVTLYSEPFGIDRIITFTCIWIALFIFTAETVYHHRRKKQRGLA